jgi:hypothetical protein
MSNFLYIPKANPIKFYELNPVELPQYISRKMGVYPFIDTVQPWEEKRQYFQKWQTSDITPLQFTSNFDPISWTLYDCKNNAAIALSLVNKRDNPYQPGSYVYEAAMSYAGLDEGYYIHVLQPGSDPTYLLVSEPQWIKERHEGSMLQEYKNSKFHRDVLYETGIQFGFRTIASLGRLVPGSKDTLYEDQILDQTVLKSLPYDTWPLTIGGSWGVPDWEIQLQNEIWSCDQVKCDNVLYTKAAESNFEFVEQQDVPVRGLKIQIREQLNRASMVFSPGVDPNKRIIVVHNIKSAAFGDLSNNAGNNIVVITGLE